MGAGRVIITSDCLVGEKGAELDEAYAKNMGFIEGMNAKASERQIDFELNFGISNTL